MKTILYICGLLFFSIFLASSEVSSYQILEKSLPTVIGACFGGVLACTSIVISVLSNSSKKTKTIAHSDSWEFSQFNWAPDSRWVAYADGKTNDISVLYIYSMENKKAYQVTSDFFNSSDPEFSENGKYLYFVSDRTFRGKSGHFEYNVTFNDMSTLFALTLQDTLTNIFTTFESDEVEVTEETKEKKSKKKKTKKDKKDNDKNINIDLDGIGDRVFELPVKSANYGGLVSVSNKLYYVRVANNDAAFYVFDFEEKEESKVGDFTGYEISANGKNIFLVKGGKYYIEKLGAKVKAKTALDLSKMETMIDRKQEWEQIFDESWRQMKYFFYDPSMHKVDWNKIYKRYKQLVKHCTNRDDLTYVVGEMIGEVNCSHAYVGGGDAPRLKRTGIGLLGADIIWDGKGFKLERILRGRNWESKTRSPLTGPGIDIKEGQYIVAIDGVKLTKSLHPLTQLTGKVNEYVTLSINSTPNLKDAKEVIIKTIANESKLRYYNWVEDNREKVNKASNGKIAYIHIPDMGFGNGLNEFFKYYFPQQDKEGLIIDDRYNGGGNVSTIIMERLKRNFTLAGNARNSKNVTIKTGGAFLGPMVCLINENSMSDGDLFPYQFKQENLGKIIGKRSWGGVIGIRGSLPFVDGGYMTRPEFSHFSSDGRWILESYGQDPDIEIDNNPIDEYYGQDDQLTKGLEVIKNEMKTYKGPKLPKVPTYPNRSK